MKTCCVIFSAPLCCIIPLIKTVQVSMVLLYLTGVPTLWNHWGFLVALLFQRVKAGEPGWGVVWGNIHLWFRDLHPTAYRNMNCEYSRAERSRQSREMPSVCTSPTQTFPDRMPQSAW